MSQFWQYPELSTDFEMLEGEGVFKDGENWKWPLSVNRKSEISCDFEAAVRIPNIIRKRNISKYQGEEQNLRPLAGGNQLFP